VGSGTEKGKGGKEEGKGKEKERREGKEESEESLRRRHNRSDGTVGARRTDGPTPS
jgi:hypothetical protein